MELCQKRGRGLPRLSPSNGELKIKAQERGYGQRLTSVSLSLPLFCSHDPVSAVSPREGVSHELGFASGLFFIIENPPKVNIF